MTFRTGPLALDRAALFTDLYQLTMAAAYFEEGAAESATFSLFVRALPRTRGFLVAAGLEDVLEYLAGFRFDDAGLRYLASLGRFAPAFLDYLRELRFTGDVRAVPEGTVLGPAEPLLEVTAPILQAQLVESAVLNLCHVQTVIASKAARVTIAAAGRRVAEFGLRRSHGVHAGLVSARSAWIAGCDQTSDVLAGDTWGLPLAGTMAHSFIMAFADELDAFRAYARVFPDSAVLLIDTYDTLQGARHAAVVASELAARGHRLAAVRLDSGDLAALSRDVRRILDEAGHTGVGILASGGLDEHDLAELVAAGAPIGAFGVGTRMNVSADAPSLDFVYKLVSHAGRDVLKLSTGKETWVAAKQLHRLRSDDGRLAGDVLALADEPVPAGAEPLLEPVMREGRALRPHPPLPGIRERCIADLAALPDGCRRLVDPEPFPVRPSAALRARQHAATEGRRVAEA